MRARPSAGMAALALAVTLLQGGLPTELFGQGADQEGPFAMMERLVGGRWFLDATSYHEFAWGVGSRSMRSRSFFVVDGQARLVSEGIFFYHPGDEVVKGVAVAVDMGIDLFEYRSVVARGDTLVLDFSAYGSAVGKEPMRETWAFTGPHEYVWTLWRQNEEGAWISAMEGTYRRVRSAGD